MKLDRRLRFGEGSVETSSLSWLYAKRSMLKLGRGDPNGEGGTERCP